MSDGDRYHGDESKTFTTRRSPGADAAADHASVEVVLDPAREVPIKDRVDVLVVGGGPAGCAAATAAARLGRKVTLVERYGHLGGLATGGLVIWIDRMTDWQGVPVIAGYGQEVLDRLPQDALIGPQPRQWGSKAPDDVGYWAPRSAAFRDTVTWSPTVDPEWLKLVSMEMLLDAGARLVLHAWAVRAVVDDGRVRGAIFESKEGAFAILADVVIDASGDLDLCAAAQIAHDAEEPGEDIAQCLNTCWLCGGVDVERWLRFRREQPAALRELVQRGTAELGFLELPDVSWRSDVMVLMGPRIGGYSGIRVDDLTAVEIESRTHMKRHLAFFREHLPGFEDAWLLTSAPQIGVRHTRRLTGVRPVLQDEWRAGVRHADEIGVSPSPSPRFASVSVSYGALVPVSADGLLVAGRHVGCDVQSQVFLREIPQCWMTGQAAGVASAIASATGVAPREVDHETLAAELRAQGAYLQQGSAALP